MNDCLFCKIAAGSAPSARVEETDTLLAFDDVNPVAPTHVLIIPKKHIDSCVELTENDRSLVGEIHLLAVKIAKQRGLARSGFRLVTNTGPTAGQSVFHLHYHLIGGRVMNWPPG